MAAAWLACADSVVADPAAGRFRGSKRELLVGRILTPSQWLPKPASRWLPKNSLLLRDQRSPSDGERVAFRSVVRIAGVLPVCSRSLYYPR